MRVKSGYLSRGDLSRMLRTALLVTGFSRECSLCRQLVDENTRREDSSNAWLFGHDAYALCPRCLQEVPEDLRTSRYRRGWDKLADRLLKGRDQPHAGAKPSLSSFVHRATSLCLHRPLNRQFQQEDERGAHL